MGNRVHDKMGSRDDRVEFLTPEQHGGLLKVESCFMDEMRQTGEGSRPRWHSLFEAGARDQNGAVWALYNSFGEEESPQGWQVYRAAPGETSFDWVAVESVLRTDLTTYVQSDKPLVTYQFRVGTEENRGIGMRPSDILNIIFDGEEPGVHFWDHSRSMKPLSFDPAVEFGGRALAQTAGFNLQPSRVEQAA